MKNSAAPFCPGPILENPLIEFLWPLVGSDHAEGPPQPDTQISGTPSNGSLLASKHRRALSLHISTDFRRIQRSMLDHKPCISCGKVEAFRRTSCMVKSSSGGPPFPALSAMALVTGLKLTRDIGVSTSQRDGRMYLGAPAQVFSVTSMLSI